MLWAGVGPAAPTRPPSARAEPWPVQAERLEYDEEQGGWVTEAAPEPGTPEGDLRRVRVDLAERRHREAYRRIKDWLKTYGEADPLYPQAAVLRARIEIARRDYYKAHKQLQVFLNQFRGTRVEEEAIHYEFVIAEVFLSGTKRKFLGLRILPADDVGVRILDDLTAHYPESTTAELALKTKADHFFRKGDFALAEMEYARLRDQFPRSRYTRYALRRGAEAALASFPGIEFDEAPLIEAEARFHDYLNQYPGIAEQEGVGLILDDIREQRAAKELHVGRYYARTGQPGPAAFYYRSTITHWPETIAAREAHSRLTGMGLVPEPGLAEEAGGLTEHDASTQGVPP